MAAVSSLPHAPSRPSEHPVAVLQPQPQTAKPQTQPRDRDGREPPPSLDKPWEAIRPVQPHLDSAPYRPPQHQHPPAAPCSADPQAPPPPPPPVRSLESKLATAVLSRSEAAAYHHAFLESEGSPPPLSLSLGHALTLPRKSSYVYHAPGAERLLLDTPTEPYYASGRTLPLAYAYRADPLSLGYASDVSRYATIGPRSYHHSLKAHHRPIRSEYLPSPAPGHAHHHRSHAYGHVSPAYPSIRRVHSLHASAPPTVAVRGPPVSRTEVPPPAPSDEDMFYYQRPQHHCRGYAPPAEQQQDYHVTRLQPFFENGRVQYRYSPYGEPPPPDSAHCYEPDQYAAALRLRHAHSFGGRERQRDGGGAGAKSGAYHYLLHQRQGHAHPPQGHAHQHLAGGGGAGVKEHGFVSRDVPPHTHTHTHLHASQGQSVGGVCLAWEGPEEAERLRGHSHSLRRESRTRQRLKGPVLSQYDNLNLHLGPYLPPPDPPMGTDPHDPHDPRAAHDALQHLRSKSDPGKEARYNVTPETAMPRSHTAEPHAFLYMETHSHTHSHMGPRSHTPSSQASQPDDPNDRCRGLRSPEGEAPLKPTAASTPHTHTHTHTRPQRHPHSSTLSHYDNLEEYRPAHTPTPAHTHTLTLTHTRAPGPPGLSGRSGPLPRAGLQLGWGQSLLHRPGPGGLRPD